MRNIYTLTISSLYCFVMFWSPAYADKLPKNATPLSPADVSALYSDHTAVWSSSAMAYFAADGTMKEFVAGQSKPGSWTVKDNEFCMEIKGVEAKTKKLDGKTYTECWQWYKDSKNQLYSLYSKHWDNSKVDMTDFSKKEIKHLKPGDLVGAKYKPVQG
jgi:hypothetical protein